METRILTMTSQTIAVKAKRLLEKKRNLCKDRPSQSDSDAKRLFVRLANR